MATKLLKELHREAKRDRGWLLRWVHSFCRYNHRRSQTQGPVEQIGAMLKTVPLLGKWGLTGKHTLGIHGIGTHSSAVTPAFPGASPCRLRGLREPGFRRPVFGVGVFGRCEQNFKT